MVAEPALAAELADADLGDVRASDVRLPFDAVFVAFGGVAVGDVGANPAPADGAYLARRGDAIAALVVGRRKAAPGRARWPLGGDPVAEVVVPARRLPGDGGPTLDEAIRAAVGAGRPDGAALLAALRFAFNVVAYATARPADREAFDEVAGPAAPTAPRARPDRARPRRHPDRMTVVLVGGASGARARAEAAAGAVGGVRAAHWRRGHHKRQRHGPGLTLVKVIYVERVYVGGREARGAPRPRVPGRVTRLVAREGRPRAAEGRTGV